jgi:HAL2 family 3'(2'),5'-bisphosphate nucleotidase
LTNLSKELELTSESAIRASRLCLAVRQQMVDMDQLEKAGREPVTVADFGSQMVILKMIAEHFPDDQVFAEERGKDFREVASYEQQAAVLRYVESALESSVSPEQGAAWLDAGRGQSSSRVWTVDPIDGTKGFLRGEQFAVAIGLLVDGQPALSVLGCPFLPVDASSDATRGVLATAVKGQGASIQPLGGDQRRPLQVSKQLQPNDARVVESVEAGHSDHDLSAKVLAGAGVAGSPLRMDSQAKYAAVADGRAEIYLRLSVGEGYAEKVWDHAAGVLIVQEAGGRVTDLDGKPLDFAVGERLSANRGVLATNGPLHDPLLAALAHER